MVTCTVVGAGKSGVAAALLASAEGHRVFLTEAKPAEQCAEAASVLAAAGIDAEFGGHSSRACEAEMMIVSPGIPPHAPLIIEAERLGVPIIGEIEFAWRVLRAQFPAEQFPVVAITGTNGKTTTTALTAHVLNASGRKAVACGNIGLPLSSVVRDMLAARSGDAPVEPSVLVVETSSYQLDRTVDFAPEVAMLLNITPDHLSYHGTMERYALAKWKISANQNKKNVLILCADDPETVKVSANSSRAQRLYFSVRAPQHGAYTDSNRIVFSSQSRADQHKEEFLMTLDDLRMPGVHNVYNSMAAALAARAFEIRNENIRDSLMSFRGVEHRLEFVRILNNVEYINDSKATNVNSTWYALSSFKKPLVWIAGGRGDNNDYTALDELVRARVQAIVSIGEEADAIFHHFSSAVRCVKAASLDEAVRAASRLAEPDAVVLFSPACKSFDMFANYEHRGDVFKQIVQAL